MELGVQYYGLTANVARGGGCPALIELSLFPLSPIPNCLSFPYIYLSLSLPLSASDDVSQSGFENSGKLLFMLLHCISIMKLQVVLRNSEIICMIRRIINIIDIPQIPLGFLVNCSSNSGSALR